MVVAELFVTIFGFYANQLWERRKKNYARCIDKSKVELHTAWILKEFFCRVDFTKLENSQNNQLKIFEYLMFD